jgi:membrane-associated phospholipid phosphatase
MMNADESSQITPFDFSAIGFRSLIIGFPIFVVFTLSVIAAEGGATPLDIWLIDLLRAIFNWFPEPLNRFIRSSGYFSFFLSLLLGLVLPFYWLWKHRFRNARLIFFSTWGSFIVWVFLIYAFDRVRPQPIIAGDLPGYPSGHALSMFTIYGLLLYIFFEDIRRLGWTRRILVTWFFWAALNGLSRLYLEQHYPTDVLAGYALGAAWLGFTLRFLPGPDRVVHSDRGTPE